MKAYVHAVTRKLVDPIVVTNVATNIVSITSTRPPTHVLYPLQKFPFASVFQILVFYQFSSFLCSKSGQPSQTFFSKNKNDNQIRKLTSDGFAGIYACNFPNLD